MSYLKGSKRLAVIHRWLNGIDDPNYEVLPTRKEGKYIVKKRVSELDSKPEVTTTEDTVQPDVEQVTEEHEVVEQGEVEQEDEQEEQEEPEQPPIKPISRKQPPVKSAPSKQPSSKPITRKQPRSKPAPIKQPSSKQPPIKQPPSKQPSSKPTSTNNYDPTINLEILEQLKLLGDEIRSKRERREQKQLINHVLDKRMRKQQPHKLIPQSQPVEEYEYYSEDNEPVQQPVQQQPIVFKSRIRR